MEKAKELLKDKIINCTNSTTIFDHWDYVKYEDAIEAVNKAFNIPVVSNWGELKNACKHSIKHNTFMACTHKDSPLSGVCFDPASCPMIKKWSKCAYNRHDC